jgi:asparagine synthase (glutamine-hydrolysing)
MRERTGPVVCFTSVYGEQDRGEANWAATAAAPYGIAPVEVLAPRTAWRETMERIAWHMDGPGYSPAVFPLWAIMAQARASGVPVLLEGQGADEELAGYPSYAALDMLASARRALKSPANAPAAWREWRSLSGTFTPFWLGAYVLRESVPGLLPRYRRWLGAERVLSPQMRDYGRGMSPLLESFVEGGRDPVTQRLMADHRRDILPGLLHYGDAISMAHGVESRQPFLDFRLVDWLFRAPLSLKLRDGQTKWVLRRYLESRQQAAIAARVSKLGYPTKVEHWLVEDDARLARDLLLSPDSQMSQFCDVRALRTWLRRAARDSGWSSRRNHLYRLVSAELWLRACMRPQPARGMAA